MSMPNDLDEKSFFPSNVPEFLHMAFNLLEKHCPLIQIAGLHLVFEKN